MRILSHSAQKTLSIGRMIAAHLNKGDIICLYGDLGSGKTVLAKGISSGLGADKDRVASPTFVILRQYEARIPVYHFDLYRLDLAEDILDLGYEEYLFGEGVSMIEWAEKLGKLMPREAVKIKLTVAGKNLRKLEISAQGARYRRLLEKLSEDFRR